MSSIFDYLFLILLYFLISPIKHTPATVTLQLVLTCQNCLPWLKLSPLV